jgi:anaerobic carbon-monoxide dehydrogenase iron sulfur subunit
MKRLLANSLLCSGCRMCELVCSIVHENEFVPSKARIRIMIDRGIRPDTPAESIDVPNVCTQCDPAPCAQACPIDAIGIDRKVQIPCVDGQICNGCGLCLDACPHGMIFVDDVRQVAYKCDLCAGDPMCVIYCPRDALEYVSPE